jgi:hypothetical protein
MQCHQIHVQQSSPFRILIVHGAQFLHPQDQAKEKGSRACDHEPTCTYVILWMDTGLCRLPSALLAPCVHTKRGKSLSPTACSALCTTLCTIPQPQGLGATDCSHITCLQSLSLEESIAELCHRLTGMSYQTWRHC